MERNRPTVTVYDEIKRDVNIINAWTVSDCLPIDQDEYIDLLNQYSVIEVAFEGCYVNEFQLNEINKCYRSFLKEYLLLQSLTSLIFKFSDKSQKNRIRSYKGVIPKEISKNDTVQIEYNLPNNYSIIAGLIKMSKKNIEYLNNFGLYRNNSFIFLTKNTLWTEEKLQSLTGNILNKSRWVVNYLKLCTTLNDDEIIIREGGDWGDQELSWQIFTRKQNKADVLKYIDEVLLKKCSLF